MLPDVLERKVEAVLLRDPAVDAGRSYDILDDVVDPPDTAPVEYDLARLEGAD